MQTSPEGYTDWRKRVSLRNNNTESIFVLGISYRSGGILAFGMSFLGVDVDIPVET